MFSSKTGPATGLCCESKINHRLSIRTYYNLFCMTHWTLVRGSNSTRNLYKVMSAKYCITQTCIFGHVYTLQLMSQNFIEQFPMFSKQKVDIRKLGLRIVKLCSTAQTQQNKTCCTVLVYFKSFSHIIYNRRQPFRFNPFKVL